MRYAVLRGHLPVGAAGTERQSAVRRGIVVITQSIGVIAALLILAPAVFADGQVVGWGSDVAGQVSRIPGSLLPYNSVAAGSSHSVAIRRDGSIVCWGNNDQRQCEVPSGLASVVGIAAGEAHTVALEGNGRVVCWGSSLYGIGTPPTGLDDVICVASGQFHAMALTASGRIACWGRSSEGQCEVPGGMGRVIQISASGMRSMALADTGIARGWGLDVYGENEIPPEIADVQQIAAGRYHTALLRSGGVISCVGSNDMGEGDVPPGVSGTVRRVVAGAFHTVAVQLDGHVVCWGDNSFGQCDVPAQLSSIEQVSAGWYHTCALDAAGKVTCWGANFSGQSRPPRSMSKARQIAAGEYHSALLRPDGLVECSGFNDWGQCDVPSAVQNVTQVATRGLHTAARMANGLVACWGYDAFGQCRVPAELEAVVQVSAGYWHTVACLQDGSVKCWGRNSRGQATVPEGLGPSRQVAGGWEHTLALGMDGAVRGWGYDYFGQCTVPQGVGEVAALDAGGDHSIALRENGTVVCWGGNVFGQTTVPPGLSDVTSIAAGWSHNVVLKFDGTVVCWGWNARGQTVPPAGLTRVVQVAAGVYNSLALLDDELSSCASRASAGTCEVSSSGGTWADVNTWRWLDSGPAIPGVQSIVDLGATGSVGSECSANAATFISHPGASLLISSRIVNSHVVDTTIRVDRMATLAGRLWLLAGESSVLPEDLNVPVLSAATVVGNFDLIQTDVSPPPGFFLTLVPEDVNGRTVLSLRLLPLSVGGSLSGSTGTVFSGSTVGAETIDINHDGFDDLALAIDFGAGQNGLVQILLNDGAGNLGGTSALAAIPPQPTCLAVGDVDGDGDRDVVVGVGSDGTVRVLLDNGAGGFVAGTVIGNLGGTPLAVAVRDVAGGTQLTSGSQIVVGTSSNSLKTFSGSGGPLQTIALAGTPSVVKVGTIAGTRGKGIATGGTTSNSVDGLTAMPTGFVQTILPRVDQSLELVQTMYLTAKPVSMDVADLDGDGLDDIVTANADPVLPAAGSALPVLAIFRNTNGLFGGAVPYQPAGASSGLSVSLVDVDNDGDRDIVSVHRTIGLDSDAALLRVDTLGAGTPISIGQTTVLDTNDPILSARGNLDGGGGEDIFLVNQGMSSSLAGTGEAKPFVSVGQSRQGDLDGDGHVGTSDLALLLLDFGPCFGCISDLDTNDDVDTGDLALILLLFD
jgi:alpha-tubulin suppressor-like RCC1 family protein